MISNGSSHVMELQGKSWARMNLDDIVFWCFFCIWKGCWEASALQRVMLWNFIPKKNIGNPAMPVVLWLTVLYVSLPQCPGITDGVAACRSSIAARVLGEGTTAWPICSSVRPGLLILGVEVPRHFFTLDGVNIANYFICRRFANLQIKNCSRLGWQWTDLCITMDHSAYLLFFITTPMAYFRTKSNCVAPLWETIQIELLCSAKNHNPAVVGL